MLTIISKFLNFQHCVLNKSTGSADWIRSSLTNKKQKADKHLERQKFHRRSLATEAIHCFFSMRLGLDLSSKPQVNSKQPIQEKNASATRDPQR